MCSTSFGTDSKGQGEGGFSQTSLDLDHLQRFYLRIACKASLY